MYAKIILSHQVCIVRKYNFFLVGYMNLSASNLKVMKIITQNYEIYVTYFM